MKVEKGGTQALVSIRFSFRLSSHGKKIDALDQDEKGVSALRKKNGESRKLYRHVVDHKCWSGIKQITKREHYYFSKNVKTRFKL